MKTNRLAVIALALAGLLLAGCSDDDNDNPESKPSETSSTTDKPDKTDEPSEDAVGTDDFSFVAPDGWDDVSDTPVAGAAEIAFADTSSSSDFANNINVIKSAQPGLDTDEFEEAAIAELETAGFEDVKIEDRYEIDGDEVPVVTAKANQSGQEYLTRQYLAENGDSTFVITFSFGSDVSEDEMIEISESVMDTWTWKN